MCNPRFLQSRARAFTLIELLVVIGLIAILASILLPVLNTAHAQSDAMKCAANLRQLGTAISSYAGDHEGRLPGPVTPLIYPAYTVEGGKDDALVKFLAQYLSVSAKNDTNTAGKPETVTTCPAFVGSVKNGKTLPSYVLNFADTLPDLNQTPWGDSAGNLQPVQLAVLTAWADTVTSGTHIPSPNGQRNLSRTWAIKDADKGSFRNMNISATTGLPDKPVHGDYRSALFYDWHVAKIDLDDNPK